MASCLLITPMTYSEEFFHFFRSHRMTNLVRATRGANAKTSPHAHALTHKHNSGRNKFEESFGTVKSPTRCYVGKVFLTLRKKLGITEEPSITEFQVSNSYPELLRIDGEPIQFEWNIFPGRASSEMLQKVQEYLQSRRLEPAGFRDRIIFMTMFNDFDWTKEGNSEKWYFEFH